MAVASNEFERLNTREGFNRSLRHFKLVMELVQEMEDHNNLADVINELAALKELEENQITPILSSLLIDKYGYKYYSYNLKDNVDNFQALKEEMFKWNAVDLVLAYFHPELGIMTINPKISSHWEAVQVLKKNELLIIYAGAFNEEGSEKLLNDAITKIIALLEGRRFKTPALFLNGKFRAKEEAPKKEEKQKSAPKAKKASSPIKGGKQVTFAPPPPAAKAPEPKATGISKRKMTPMYSIPVTNELFHNGNVEAWKKIIQSYTTKNPDLEVLIFYDGEKINDINTLFKWGKVKHGSSILISVVGENICDVAKLQRYLKQGASNGFEAFLRFPVNTILNLF